MSNVVSGKQWTVSGVVGSEHRAVGGEQYVVTSELSGVVSSE